ncbi:hypothetical protein CBM2598_U50020 [Cupriavidus taiwanensis]|uniref:Uncharacterized protein n=1 Tax=Cupriavidus taiwanensis TaxID=164546 RepID=A0A7Z7JGJ8_9BURK|nr:hypothetical protein CBM2597_U50020 [Cupriavidus taiwanensis]SOZ97264.1 hypothetical protein CBM2598_U50020 [Cupriavidus taiwanensis]SPC26154.1 hypothetical protein CBM2594_U60020 [Cupriavidus taiwanensis]
MDRFKAEELDAYLQSAAPTGGLRQPLDGSPIVHLRSIFVGVAAGYLQRQASVEAEFEPRFANEHLLESRR